MENAQVYKRFIDYLERRQANAKSDLDIRSHFDEWRHRAVSAGYKQIGLEHGFPSNLAQQFYDITGMDEPDWGRARNFLAHGSIPPPGYHMHPGCRAIFETLEPSDSLLFAETSFIASVASWSVSSRDRDPRHAAVGYVFDDIAHYFMTDYPNRLVQKLNSPASLSAAEQARAQGLMERVVAHKISKYNNQPFRQPAFAEDVCRRVLVVDQSFADASTLFGRANEETFEKMLLAAVRENPDAEIIVKTHPDSIERKQQRQGFFSHMQDRGRVRFLRESVNPYVIFEAVDKVYVVTSQVGFEAAMAGKEVVCFGAPIYAGWGFTDDRQPIPHRKRRRTPLEFFHYFYIWYTHYWTPESPAECEIEEVLDYIVRHRSCRSQLVATEDTPEVSVIIPVHDVEGYIEECIGSVQTQTLTKLEIIPVNDASPDGSQTIIDKLAVDDPRIRPVILTENAGQGFARNRGIDASRGDYVLFLDGDDLLADASALECLCKRARTDDADMVRGRKVVRRYSADGRYTENRDQVEHFLPGEVHGTTYRAHTALLYNGNCWNFLYNRDFLREHDIKFTLPKWEERVFLTKAFLRSSRISCVDIDLTIYRVRTESTVRKAKDLRDVDLQTENFSQVVSLLLAEGAGRKGSELHYHLRFLLTDCLHHTFFGFAFRTACDNGPDAVKRLLDTWAAIVQRSGLEGGDLVAAPSGVSNARFESGGYALIFESLCAERFDLARLAAEEKPLPPEEIYRLFLEGQAPKLVAAVNHYLPAHAAKPGGTPRSRRSAEAPLRLLVHAGASKTGSTYLQHFMELNRPALLRRGVWVPEFGLYRQPGRPHKMGGHGQFLQEAKKGGRELRAALHNGLAEIGDEVHTVVISSEGFFLSPASEVLATHLREFNPEMVVYLRRQDEWASSQYAEFVGGGALGRVSAPVEEWLAESRTQERLDYERFLRRWLEKLPQEKIHVRPFEREALKNADLLEDFLDCLAIGPDSEFVRPSPEQVNDGQLSAAQLEVMRSFNALTFPDNNAYLRFVERGHQIFRSTNADDPPAKATILTTQQRRELLDNAEAGNRWIAETFLGRDDGVLFSNLEVASPATTKGELERVPAEEVAALVASYNTIVRPEPRKQGGKPAPTPDKKHAEPDKKHAKPDKKNAKPDKKDAKLAAAERELAKLKSSRSWRITAPLRFVSRNVHRVLRGGQVLFVAFGFAAIGRFGKAGRILLPYYRRWMPKWVKAAVPSALRSSAKRRLSGMSG